MIGQAVVTCHPCHEVRIEDHTGRRKAFPQDSGASVPRRKRAEVPNKDKLQTTALVCVCVCNPEVFRVSR